MFGRRRVLVKTKSKKAKNLGLQHYAYLPYPHQLKEMIFCSPECVARGQVIQHASKKCAHCGKLFNRRKSGKGHMERMDGFNSRKYCNNECYIAFRRRGVPEKYCLYCGVKLQIHQWGIHRESLPVFKQRKTCSKSCGIRLRAFKRHPDMFNRVCEYCKKPLVRKKYRTEEETLLQFVRRKHCNLECLNKHKHHLRENRLEKKRASAAERKLAREQRRIARMNAATITEQSRLSQQAKNDVLSVAKSLRD